jgi:translation initiation factor SUI1
MALHTCHYILRDTSAAYLSFCPLISLPSEKSRKADVNPAERNGRKTLTTVQGLPKKFDQKKILKVIKKQFACNGTVVADSEMGEVIQLQGDQRKDVQDFLTNKKEGLGLDGKTIKVHGF